MNKHYQSIMLLTLLLLLAIQPGFAQDTAATTALTPETAVEEVASEEADVPAGQEVEVNEDNYRLFMELKDSRGQRNIQPENAFKPQSGLQKLDKLPEESQKHLRNQLREIIVAGEQWQPGDEDTDYPYVPSEAASTDTSLHKQEAEAWGELVDSYNKREAEIYENSSRSQAAMASEGASGGGPGNGEGSVGDNAGQGSAGQQAGQQGSSEKSSAADSYSPNSSNAPHDPNARSTAGISQNAMEFLKGQGHQGASAGEAGSSSSVGINGQGDAQEQSGQQSGSEQNHETSTSSANTSPVSSTESKTDSTTGTSQNALEFLTGNGNQAADAEEGNTGSATDNDGQEDTQTGQQDGDGQIRTVSTPSADKPLDSSNEAEAVSTTGTSQNALEYLLGKDVQTDDAAPPSPVEPEGTLSIEDLLNAQGVHDATGG